MSSTIQAVQAFSCPLCKKLSSTMKRAQTCMKKCEEKAERQKILDDLENKRAEFAKQIETYEWIVAEEAETIDDIPRLIEKYSKELLGIEVCMEINSIKYDPALNARYNGPRHHIEGQSSYPGFSGYFSIKLKDEKNRPTDNFWISQLFEPNRSSKQAYICSFPDKPDFTNSHFDDGLMFHFAGFHGGGSGNSTSVSGSFQIFIDDYPKMKPLHGEYETLKSEKRFYDQALTHLMSEHKSFINHELDTNPEMVKLNKQKKKIEELLQKVTASLANKKTEIINEHEPLKTEMIKSVDETTKFNHSRWSKISPMFNNQRIP